MARNLAVARAAVAVTTAFTMGLALPVLAQAPPATTPPAAAKPAPAAKPAAGTAAKPAAKAASPAPPDGGWPRGYVTPSGAKIVVYQPQVASWENQKHVVAYAAVSHDTGAEKPALGSVKIEAETKVSVEERLVNFRDFKITESNFPTLTKDRIRDIVTEIDRTIPQDDRIIGLDRVLASVDRSQIMPKNVEGVKADPPTIYSSQGPALLVNIDGEPIWSPIKDNDLKFAVNTNWDLFQHGPTSTLYLRNDKTWLKAADVKGPWGPAGSLPESFKKLPADENWKDVKASLPGAKVDAKSMPKVFVSSVPGRDDPAHRRTRLQAGPGHEPALGQQHRERRVPGRRDGPRLLPRGRTLVLVARLRGPLDLRHHQPARRLPEDHARAPALARAGVGAGNAAGGGGGAAGAGAPDGARRTRRS